MKHGKLLRSSSSIALLIAGLSGLAAPARADVPAPPVRQPVDGAGINVISGSYNNSTSDLSIGPADHHGLTYSRYWNGSGWRDSAMATITGSTTNPVVSVGGASEAFTKGTSGYEPDARNGATLVFEAGTGNYIYTTSGGLVARFRNNGGISTPYGANLGSADWIKYPDGLTIYFAWKQETHTIPVQMGSSTVAVSVIGQRLQSIYNTSGYELKFTYKRTTGFASSAEYDDWNNAETITAFNRAVDYCDPMADTCTLPNIWPSATYNRGSPPAGLIYSMTRSSPSTQGWTYTYDAQGALTNVRHASRSSDNVTINYNPNTAIVAIATVDGIQRSYLRSASGDVMTTTITRTGAGQEVYTSNIAAGTVASYRDETLKTTQYIYDSFGRPTQLLQPEGNKFLFEYDGRGNITKTTSKAKTGSPLADIVSTAVYPANCANPLTCNKPQSTTDALNRTTAYTYNSTHGGIVSVTMPAVTIPQGGSASPYILYQYGQYYSYTRATAGTPTAADPPMWLPTTISTCMTQSICTGSSNEIRTTMSYGPQTNGTGNNLLPVTIARGSGVNPTLEQTAMIYDAIGNVTYIDAPRSDVVDVSYYRYNADRQQVGVISPDPDGAGPLKRRAQRTLYNGAGQVTQVEAGTVNGVTDTDWTNFARLQYTHVDYDGIGRKTMDSVLDGNGSTVSATQYAYDAAGRLSCSALRMNPASYAALPGACSYAAQGSYGPDRITGYQYDNADRVIKQIGAYGLAGLQRDEATYSYTDNGKVSLVLDAKGMGTGYTYDGFDRLQRTNYPSVNGSDYEDLLYDVVGNVTDRRQRDGQHILYAYDELDRLKTVTVPNTGNNANRQFTYDLQGNMITAFTGRSGFSAQTNFAWDALGHKIAEYSLLNGASTKGKGSQYNAAGQRTVLTLPESNLFFSYEYDAVGEMTVIREGSGGALATFTYDDLGRRTSKSYPNGTSQSYTYDAASRTTSVSLNGGTQPGTIQLGNYNPAGQIGLRTLTNNSYAWAQGVAVNRGYVTNGLNQYTSIAGGAVTYDQRGNLTTSQGNTFSYDAYNQMTTCQTTVCGSATLRYDALGRLVQNPLGNRFDYDGDQLIGEYDPSNNLLTRYVFGPGTNEALIWYTDGTVPNKRYFDADERGSIIRVTDGGGGLIAVNTYDPSGIPGASNVGRFQYTGQIWLGGPGMYHYRARMYSPTLGRFMQTDPIGYDDDLNWYNYVGGDPVNKADPTGTRYFPNLAEADAAEAGTDWYVPKYAISTNFTPNNFNPSGTVDARSAGSGSLNRAATAYIPAVINNVSSALTPKSVCTICGVGGYAGINGEAGIVSLNAGKQLSYSSVAFSNGESAVFKTTGSFVGGPGYGASSPAATPNPGGMVLGASFSGSVGAVVSTARTPQAYAGLSTTYNLSVGRLSVGLSFSSSSITLTIGAGVGAGASLSYYRTQTDIIGILGRRR